MTAALAVAKEGDYARVHENIPMVNLGILKEAVSSLEPANPLRTVVASLPREMPILEYATLIPTLWRLAGNP